MDGGMEAWNKKFQPVGSVFPEGGREGGKKRPGKGVRERFIEQKQPDTHPPSPTRLRRCFDGAYW